MAAGSFATINDRSRKIYELANENELLISFLGLEARTRYTRARLNNVGWSRTVASAKSF